MTRLLVLAGLVALLLGAAWLRRMSKFYVSCMPRYRIFEQ